MLNTHTNYNTNRNKCYNDVGKLRFNKILALYYTLLCVKYAILNSTVKYFIGLSLDISYKIPNSPKIIITRT